MLRYFNTLNSSYSDKEAILLSFSVKDLVLNDVGTVELLWNKLIAEGVIIPADGVDNV